MRFKGIYTPIITPFLNDGSINWDGYAETIDWQIENGVAGIIIGGTTGEFYALTKEERVRQFTFAAKHIKDRVEFMAGVNDQNSQVCIELAKSARQYGASSLLVAAPPYSLPLETELAAHVLRIEHAAKLPIMLYNYPGRTGVNMGEAFLNLVVNNRNVVAIKESSGDIKRIHLLQQNYHQLELIAGAEDQVLEFLNWGANAWVCATGNIFPSQCVQLLTQVVNQGNFQCGIKLMSAFLPLMNTLEQDGQFIQSIKFANHLQGQPGGNPRPPMLPLDKTDQERIKKVVTEVGLTVGSILDEYR